MQLIRRRRLERTGTRKADILPFATFGDNYNHQRVNDSLCRIASDEVGCLAAFKVPGRIDSAHVAKLLGMAQHDIPILVSSGLLEPLGNPAQNSAKWFCAVEIIHLAADRDWLHKATKKLAQHWQKQNASKKQKCSVNCSVLGVKSDEMVLEQE